MKSPFKFLDSYKLNSSRDILITFLIPPFQGYSGMLYDMSGIAQHLIIMRLQRDEMRTAHNMKLVAFILEHMEIYALKGQLYFNTRQRPVQCNMHKKPSPVRAE